MWIHYRKSCCIWKEGIKWRNKRSSIQQQHQNDQFQRMFHDLQPASNWSKTITISQNTSCVQSRNMLSDTDLDGSVRSYGNVMQLPSFHDPYSSHLIVNNSEVRGLTNPFPEWHEMERKTRLTDCDVRLIFPPYKRFECSVTKARISGKKPVTVPAHERHIRRWREVQHWSYILLQQWKSI